jgi:hypothetical protein
MGKFRWALVLTIVFLLPCIAFAVPKLINYQGELSDSSGNNPVNGDVSIIFTIYNASTGGDVLWTETQTVTVTDGVFNVLLGSQNPILANTFDGNERYLGVKVSTDPEMTPRQQLASVPFSFKTACLPGDYLYCYEDDPGTLNVGTCEAGFRTCQPNGTWGDCVGEVAPVTEICDGLDNDCDGLTDEEACGHYIFVTSGSYQGDFGGLSVADIECQSYGDGGSFTSGFGATWTAVLSDNTTGAKYRFTLQGPVYNTYGDLVANDATDLWDGTLANAVGYDEEGASVSAIAWTGTLFGGTSSSDNCLNWTDNTFTQDGTGGGSDQTNSFWIDGGIWTCDTVNRFYCISSAVTP